MCTPKQQKLCGNPDCEICFGRSFASHEKAKFWSDENTRSPLMVYKSDMLKYRFWCDICFHQFDSSPSNVSKKDRGRWCPYCCVPSKKFCDDDGCEFCYDKSFMSHPKAVFWSPKNNISPRFVALQANKDYLFDCEVCGHEFWMLLASVERGQWCSFCTNKRLCNNEDCRVCYEKSFASHERVKYWSLRNELSPRQIFKFSNKKYIFDCYCGHEFTKQLCAITGEENGWCPFCANHRFCDDEECIPCFERSFSSHYRVQYWSPKNIDHPRYTPRGSDNKYLFDCHMCGHEICVSLDHITGKKNMWCAYCENKKLCNNDNCDICYNKSFASHKRSAFWSNKNECRPRDVLLGSDKKYLFNCEQKHLVDIMISAITRKGAWCRFCNNKTETLLKEFLESNCDVLVTDQSKFEWCKKITYLPFDFCIEEYKLIIELDGMQHFKQISNWNSPEETQQNDLYKMRCANANGYSVLRICQETVWYDNDDWQNKITRFIVFNITVINVVIGKIYSQRREQLCYKDIISAYIE